MLWQQKFMVNYKVYFYFSYLLLYVIELERNQYYKIYCVNKCIVKTQETYIK